MIRHQAQPPRCDLASPDSIPFSISLRREYPQAGRLVQVRVLGEVGRLQGVAAVRHLVVAWVEGAVGRSLEAWESVGVVRRCLAWAVEEVLRRSAWAEAAGLICSALVVGVGWKTLAVVAEAEVLHQQAPEARDETMSVVVAEEPCAPEAQSASVAEVEESGRRKSLVVVEVVRSGYLALEAEAVLTLDLEVEVQARGSQQRVEVRQIFLLLASHPRSQASLVVVAAGEALGWIRSTTHVLCSVAQEVDSQTFQPLRGAAVLGRLASAGLGVARVLEVGMGALDLQTTRDWGSQSSFDVRAVVQAEALAVTQSCCLCSGDSALASGRRWAVVVGAPVLSSHCSPP